MTRKTHSKYIRHHRTDPLIRYWAATILLRGDLKTHLMFGHVSDVLLSVFKHCPLSEAEREDAEAVRDWIETEQKGCGRPLFDASDIFSVNTAGIAKAMGLDAVELGILRFACLLNSHKALGQASEICGDNFTETDMCELLAALLHKPFDAIYNALHPSSLLRESGLVRPHGHWMNCRGLDNWLRTPPILASQVFRAQQDDRVLMDIFYRQAPRSTLTQHDFHQRTELALIKDYLRASFRSGAPGTNILLWGQPGTGKTEMARLLAQSLRKHALEVNTVDLEGEALTAAHRLDCYRFCQAVIGRAKHSLVVFDEVEEILCDDSFARMGFQGENRFTKGLMNNVLETNRTPAIWITNTVDGVDPAYLRRFDLVVQLTTPVPSLKKRMARRVFRDLPMEPELVDQIVQNRNITPAHMQKVTKICQRLGLESEEQTRVVVNQVLNGDLRAVRAEPLKAREKKRKAPPKLPYRPDLINCDADTDRLAECLDGDSSVRMCLFGPPGTGKTAWAEYLARRIRRPLVVKHAADILDKYVGGTEQNIAFVFEEASRTNSILMLDEVDSFLPDRSLASRHWEVTQANQFLTAMERFDGILICTTNLMESLEPATLRRFDFKVFFDYLKTPQAVEMAQELRSALSLVDFTDTDLLTTYDLTGLQCTHGDFAAVYRREIALRRRLSWSDLIAEVRREAKFRKGSASRPIGFLADL